MKRLILSIAICLATTTTTTTYANVSSEATSKAESTKINIQHTQKMGSAVIDCSAYEGISRGKVQGIRKAPDGTCELYMEQKVGELEGDYICPLNEKLLRLAQKHYKHKVLFFKGEVEYNNDFGDVLECAFVADVDKASLANTKEFNEKKLANETSKKLAESRRLSKLNNDAFTVVKANELAELKVEEEKTAKAKKLEKALKEALKEADVNDESSSFRNRSR
tara:strand:+ start:6717 stop:7382 length:666 start_codon:yes stop_codon:yes gene_type:complete